MAHKENAIFVNMCMVTDGSKVLVIDRKKKDWPGITFPGGHIEKNESFVESVIREVYEETGLTINDPVLCGTKQFQVDEDTRYVVFFYKTNQYEGTLTSSEEGEVVWMSREELYSRKTVEDLDKMLEVFDREDLSEFQYVQNGDDWGLKLL